MIERVKFVKREGMPETNSSSTHSVVISSSDLGIDSSLLKDDIIRIPKSNIDFSWEWDKYNDVITKTQYVCSILLYHVSSYGSKYDHSLLDPVINVFKDFTGKDIIFEWEVDVEDDNYEFPSIDHQGYEDVHELFDTEDAIRDFIFSPKSWLFTGNDNSYVSTKFYKVDNIRALDYPVVTASIELGGDIGRLDFDFYTSPWDSSGNDIRFVLEDKL